MLNTVNKKNPLRFAATDYQQAKVYQQQFEKSVRNLELFTRDQFLEKFLASSSTSELKT